MAMNLSEMQQDLRAAKLDGWLFYDFRGRDPIAHRILQLPPHMRTRRWYYFVPAKGTPRKLVHKIEAEALASVPGETLYYAGQDRGDAVFPEERDPLRGDGGRRNRGTGPQRRPESGELGGPGAEIRSVLDSGATRRPPGCGKSHRRNRAQCVCPGRSPRQRKAPHHGVRAARLDSAGVRRRRDYGG